MHSTIDGSFLLCPINAKIMSSGGQQLSVIRSDLEGWRRVRMRSCVFLLWPP